jgi:dolichyl-diphosphooligosaccharide--protein glycosyltransferase
MTSKKEKNLSKHKKKEVKKTNKKFSISQKNLDLIKKAIPFVLVFIVLLTAFYVRSGPINLSGLDQGVKANVLSNIKTIITQNVMKEYPNLSPLYQQELVEKEYNKVLETGKFNYNGQVVSIDDLVQKNLDKVKDAFKAPNGQTYLNAIDPYFYFRLSQYYQKNGYVGDELKKVDGKEVPWVSYRLAPNGVEGSWHPDFQIWLESFLYKINGLNENSSVGAHTKVIYLIPVFFAVLSGLVAYLLLRRFTNDLSAFFGSLVLVSVSVFVSRTVAGFVDTDAYNVFFPLLISLLLIYGFVYKDLIKTLIFVTLAGFFQGMYLWAWAAGWFMFVFISGSLLIYLGYLLVLKLLAFSKSKKEFKFDVKNDLIVFFTYIISSFIFGYLFVKENIFKLTYNGLINSVSGIASIAKNNIWPNVYSSVAELNPASFNSIISSVGGKVIFIFALFGLLMLFLNFKSINKKQALYRKLIILFGLIWFVAIVNGAFISLTANYQLLFIILIFIPIGLAIVWDLFNEVESYLIFLGILLSAWVAGTIFMSLNGVRFILLLTPAFGIAFGFGMYYLYKITFNFFKNEFGIKSLNKVKIVSVILLLLLFGVLYNPIFTSANQISKGTVPNFDDAWYNAMYKIKNESNPNAIITSWWDFGHFFAAISQRGVTFDGGSQTTPAAYWVGRLLLENNENVSVDILRMLVCGNNNAYDDFYKFVGDSTSDSVKIIKVINSTFGTTYNETYNLIKNNPYFNLTNDQVNVIVNDLKCKNPPENYLVTSQDMIGKAGVWAHWGSWSFAKKYVYDNYKTKTPEQIAKAIDENVSVVKSYIDQINNIKQTALKTNKKETDLINLWFADYPSYIPLSGKYQWDCAVKNLTLSCQNGISINLLTEQFNPGKYLTGIKFNRILLPTVNNSLRIIKVGNGSVDAVVMPGQVPGSYKIELMQYPLGGSLFTKLYYLGGFNTSHFKLFDAEQSMTGNKFYIWNVSFN